MDDARLTNNDRNADGDDLGLASAGDEHPLEREARIATYSQPRTAAEQKTKSKAFSLAAPGETKTPISTGASTDSAIVIATDATVHVEKADDPRDKLEAEIKKQFDVSFSADGEEVKLAGKTLQARRPTEWELEAAKKALKVLHPAQMVDADHGVKFVFLKEDSAVKGSAFYDQGVAYIHPREWEDPVTGKAYGIYHGHDNRLILVDTVEHEVSHNADLKFGELYSPDIAIRDKAANRLGFSRMEDKDNHKDTWMLQGKDAKEGKENKLYKLIDEDGKKVWQQYELEGKPSLDKNGQVITVTNERMRELARVFPPTLYFDDPYELSAEVKTSFYKGGESLAYLYVNCPDLYEMAKGKIKI